MSQRIFLNEILDYFMKLFYDNLKEELKLKLIQRGGIEFYPAIEGISGDCPAIFVKCKEIKTEWDTNVSNLIATYSISFCYVKQFTENSEIIKNNIDEVNKIIELLIDNINMTSFIYADNVLGFHTTRIDYESPEDALVSSKGKNLMATMIEGEVKLYNKR